MANRPADPGREQQTPPNRDPNLDVYGDSPRFARGHITRREDLIWGQDEAIRTLGNRDSMHYTNVAPQMQTFNGDIWLKLEDHALDNARDDRVRISVITGPIFTDDDPPARCPHPGRVLEGDRLPPQGHGRAERHRLHACSRMTSSPRECSTTSRVRSRSR